ncbi:Ly6/PLAUR domain-containing protein 3 [Chelonia mydas]|uniref:Ly6/PLAUR domain-containing protein 3 n=1 Tax=Chelonia mydas TaxID=8469 RepID=M7AKH6_CHEMY|nr:Ly6/PLAUR domain-containing protein 3 [Chelonia mydas]
MAWALALIRLLALVAPASPRGWTTVTALPRHHPEEEEEECEEETNYSARDHITGEAFASASESPRLDHSDGSTEASSHIRATTGLGARVFVAERDGHSSADSPSGAGSATVSPSDGVVAEGAGHGAASSPSLFATGSSGTESRTGSARESFVAKGSTTSAPDRSAAASGEARSTDGPTPGSPGNRIDAVAHIPYLATRQNESFSVEKEGGSSQPSTTATSPTSTVLAPGGASAGSHRGKNKTLCTKRPGVALVDHGLSSHDMPVQAGHAAPPSAPATVSKPEGSLERTAGDRDGPTISFPITVETPNNSPRGPLGNASAPGLDPGEGLEKNASGWVVTKHPREAQRSLWPWQLPWPRHPHAPARAAALRCYSCDGDRSCQETEDCGEQQGRCRTTALTMISRSGVSDRIQKGCDVQGKPNNSISFFSHGQIVMLAEEHCATDLCNQGVPNALSSFPSNTSLDCLSCSSSDHSCSSPSLMQIRCPDPREQCVDITAISMPEEFPQDERRIKGCGQISRCQEPLGFHNQDSFYLLQCCNSSLCNNDAHDYQESPLPLNGVTCFACEGNSSHGCTPENITRLQCQGPMTHCMEAVGSHEAGSLRCDSHSSVLLRDRGGKRLDSVVTPSGTESCAPAHSACMEAAVTLSAAPAPSGPTQCYAGLSLGPQPHTLERVTCDGEDARCYHGNGTLTAGATALECHSCVERSDGGCSPEKMKTISCPTNTQVCMETVAAVKWSHGQFLVGEKGCGLGRPGTNDKGVDLHGILAFSQVHNCNSSRCNSRLDIQAMALQPMGNESARVPNGLECYSCQGNEACSPSNATVVKCYDGYQGCFHGNVTMKVGNFSLSRPIKGCVQDKDCTKEAKGSAAVNLIRPMGPSTLVSLLPKTSGPITPPHCAIFPFLTSQLSTCPGACGLQSPSARIADSAERNKPWSISTHSSLAHGIPRPHQELGAGPGMEANVSSLWLTSPGPSPVKAKADLGAVMDRVQVIFYTVVCVGGSLGNGLVIWLTARQAGRSVNCVWFLNLAVADFIFSVTRVVPLAKNAFYPAGAWGAAAAASLPFSLYRNLVPEGKASGLKCSLTLGEGPKLTLYLLRLLCGSPAPFAIILACYGAPGALLRGRSATAPKPFKVMAAIVVTFFLCWAPYHLFLLLKLAGIKGQAMAVGLPLASSLAYLNSCANPVLYFFMGLDFRRALGRTTLAGAFRRALLEDAGYSARSHSQRKQAASSVDGLAQSSVAPNLA